MIKGFRGTSLVDYPGKLAAVVFFGGCNFRCPFCYNVDLVLPERLKALPDIPAEEILSALKEREGFIQAVVVTGGEPTLSKNALRALLEEVRAETRLAVKLDTNGSNPEILETLIEEGLIDYLALDFKTSPTRYPEIGGNFEKIKQSLKLLNQKGFPFEIRITAVPHFITQRELEALLPYFEGARLVALQRFVAEVEVLGPQEHLGLYGPKELEELRDFLASRLDTEVVLRNV